MYATAGGPPPTGPDAVTTLTGSENLLQGDSTIRTDTLIDFVDPNSVSPTLGAQPSGGLGGLDGGLNNLGNGSNGGLDSLAKGGAHGGGSSGFGGGSEGLGQQLSPDPSGHAADVQADLKESMESSTRPTDYKLRPLTPADMAPQPAPGGGIGGGQGGDLFARGISPSGSELAGANGSGGGFGGGQGGLGGSQGGDLLARGVGAPTDAIVNAGGNVSGPVDPGLGGMQGGSGSMARGLTPDDMNLAGLPTIGSPADLGFQGGLGGQPHVGDALARGLTPGGDSIMDVAGTVGTPDTGVIGASPIWAAAGAFARAGGLDLGADETASEEPTRAHEPLTQTFECPSCRRQLAFGPRFCGYCGEPLDQTMA
jgi:hypothetical protein